MTEPPIVHDPTPYFPPGLNASVDLSAIDVLPVFKLLREAGNVDEREMQRTFNLGVGMVLVVDAGIVGQVREHLSRFGMNGAIIGEITDGDKQVVYRNRLSWE